MRYYVQNFGCRATQADGAAVEEGLRARGLVAAAEPGSADVMVVNTCTVTAAADADARRWIRRARRENPSARLLVTGCYAQRAPEELAGLPGVEWVVGNSHKSEIAALLAGEALAPVSSAPGFVSLESLSASPVGNGGGGEERTLAQRAKVIVGDVARLRTVLVAPVFGSSDDRTRPTLKIQDGCNNRCAFCVIPFVRGRSRSLTLGEVLSQVQRLTDEGYQEVVLSGVDLGAYGQDLEGKPGLRELTERILETTSVRLLRFSSLEPMDLSNEFLNLLVSSDRIARHIHAPLQSGSNRILRRMHRWYTREEYAERIEQVAARWENVGIGADVIVGFPGETEEDFRQTVELIERLPFSYLHVFRYSKRPGTRAVTLDGQVPPEVIRERSRTLRALAAEKAAHFRAQQVGRSLRVLTLSSTNDDGTRNALSENYLKLRLPEATEANRLLTVRVDAVESNYLLAWSDQSGQSLRPG